MTKVVIVGDMYYSDLSVGGGPMPGGPGYIPGLRPDNSLPGGQGGYPSHPITGLPVDPGYGVPGGIPGTRPPPGSVDPGWGVTPGVRPSHPIYNPAYPDNSLPGGQGGVPTHPIYIPPQAPPIDPADPTKAYVVGYVPKSGGGYERITFTVDIPEPITPTEPEPK